MWAFSLYNMMRLYFGSAGNTATFLLSLSESEGEDEQQQKRIGRNELMLHSTVNMLPPEFCHEIFSNKWQEDS